MLSRRTTLLGLLATTGGLSACSAPAASPSPSAPSASATPTPTPLSTPAPPAPRWPLTGLPLADPAAAQHAVIAVKVPDNRNEHPQVGLNEADIVFVQLEGYPDASGQSSTRLMPVYHSTFPAAVAPVRSIRPVDVPLLSPLRAVLASTGASEWVENYARSFSQFVQTDLTYLRAKASGSYSLDQSRVRTYQGRTYFDRATVCHPGTLAQQPNRFASGPPQPAFPFAPSADLASTASGTPARTVGVPWKKGTTYSMTYTFDDASGRYLRSMPWGKHVLAGGAQVTTDNVLVIRAKQRVAKLAAGGGAPDPIHEIIDASGEFHYAHGGKVVTGTWAKAGVEAPFTFTLADGRPLLMAPGRTFVELPRADAVIAVS